MIIEKMLAIAATSVIGGVLAEAFAPDNISTTFIGICATILLFVVKELLTLTNRISKIETKLDNILKGGEDTQST